MRTQEITIRVDSTAAEAYRAVPESDRHKLDLLLSLRLHEVLKDDRSLLEVMREISARAQARGLTPEILTSLLG